MLLTFGHWGNSNTSLLQDHQPMMLRPGVLSALQVMLNQPVARKAVRRADLQMIALYGKQATGPHPLIDDGRGQFVADGVEKTTPKAIQHSSSPHLHTELSTGVDSG